VIDVIDVDKRWGATWALQGVSLRVARGELVALVGESGSGKSTTLKLINRLAEPTRGQVLVGGRDVMAQDPVALRRTIGTVFQRFALFPHLSVAENVGLLPRLLGWAPADTLARTRELLQLVGLAPDVYQGRFPRELSGGQQQRVGLARALAARPALMLMDEPFGALDPITRGKLGAEYRRIHDELGLTTLMVTHDMVEALLLADRIAVMAEGRVLQVGTPRELLAAPSRPFGPPPRPPRASPRRPARPRKTVRKTMPKTARSAWSVSAPRPSPSSSSWRA